MSFNAVGQYTGNHKAWDHVGNVIPDVMHCEGIKPHYEFQPAPWLPVQFFDKHFENWYTVMPGKQVACDQDGYLMPAEYAAGVAASTTVTYTSDDVAAGTIDVATGAAVTAAKVVTLTNLTGVRDATWTAANAGVTAVTSAFMGRWGIAWDPASYAIGVAPYGYLQHPGGDGSNPANFTFHNYNMQHQVAIVCDYVIKLPLVPGQVATESLSNAWASSAITFGTANGWRNITWILGTARYAATTGLFPAAATYPVAALPLDNFPVAPNTVRTTLECSDATLLVTEKGSMAAISQAGDFWVDQDVGVLFVYSFAGTSMPIGAGETLTYYHYASIPAVLSKFACVLANTVELKAGDFLVCTTGSNWTRVATPGPTNTTANFANVLGQVIGMYTEPRGGLEKVRTAYGSLNTSSAGSMANALAGSASVNLGQMDQMPGSATGGVSDLVHYAGAADTIVLINLINR